MNLENIQKLLSLVDQFKQVKRTINNAGQEEKENDAEHSYELAILSWFLATHLEPNLNLEKILLYSLVHDLVEAYAGDTNAFNQDDLATKELREHEALQTIQREFQFFPKLAQYIIAYENQSDAESIFVKSVDKIQPILLNLRDEGRSWKKFHSQVKFDNLVALKERTIKHQGIFKIWELLKKEIDSGKYLSS